ncbi:permease [Pseudoduganella ginsengisoli]|uniref:Alpha/beta hydrolase n=1 Tax=Pseudoduganella ginsengisoli TaxID=1462440 RepID=A0A6L6Q172_9BURK|nr:alpha/beta hydrolase [Pseudoduganella ginsengisoli]MTW03385.1 alpha/beta hydrolase [Pseudoduganella ginsengisoli]
MPNKIFRASELAGATRLATGAVQGVADIAEALHTAILSNVPAGKPLARAASLVYGGVRSSANLVGAGLERTLAALQPFLGESAPSNGREALIAAVNGVLGDTLARSNNPLAISMQLRRHGAPLAVGAEMERGQITGRIVVLVHGLCMNDLQWRRHGHDHGELLWRERGYTPVYLHYNTGRHIAENGRDFARQLQALALSWPVPVTELAIIGHSMGGLVTRSACHYGAEAGYSWLKLLTNIVFLGSPHHGAPLEQGGNWVHVMTDLSKYSAPFSRLAKLRSAGITDLRHGSLLDTDWLGRDRFAHGAGLPAFVPLPQGVACHAVAGAIDTGRLRCKFVGDGLVPLDSALGRDADPARTLAFAKERQAIVHGINHMELLNAPQVADILLQWM